MRDDILEHISYPETMDEKKKVFLTTKQEIEKTIEIFEEILWKD